MAKQTKIPAKWSIMAGGTAAAPGKHGYDIHFKKGSYDIQPISSSTGRHIGYRLYFVNDRGALRGGLWQILGMFSSPNEAKGAAQKHFGKNWRYLS